MLTQSWTGQELIKEFADCDSLGEVITKVEKITWEKGEVICEVHVNDTFLSESDEVKFASSRLEEIKKLIVLSRKPSELVDESMATALEWLPKIKTLAFSCSRDFRQNTSQADKKNFIEMLDACQWVSESIFLLKGLVLKDVTDTEFKDKWKQTEIIHANIARECLSSFDSGDYILLSDVLEYDLVSVLDQWEEILTKCKEL